MFFSSLPRLEALVYATLILFVTKGTSIAQNSHHEPKPVIPIYSDEAVWGNTVDAFRQGTGLGGFRAIPNFSYVLGKPENPVYNTSVSLGRGGSLTLSHRRDGQIVCFVNNPQDYDLEVITPPRNYDVNVAEDISISISLDPAGLSWKELGTFSSDMFPDGVLRIDLGDVLSGYHVRITDPPNGRKHKSAPGEEIKGVRLRWPCLDVS